MLSIRLLETDFLDNRLVTNFRLRIVIIQTSSKNRMFLIDVELSFLLFFFFVDRFLLADQLKGPSSVDGFIHALMRGCRCLELHCFDGPDNQPLVHNGTLTTRIPSNEALEAINSYAFETSRYSNKKRTIENHLYIFLVIH